MTLARILLGITLGIGTLVPRQAAEAGDWQHVGWFRSDSRNLSVSDSLVRVVSAVDVERLDLHGADYAADSAIVARFYPDWDLHSDLVVYYRATSRGFVQSSYEYKVGVERTALPGDTVSANLGVFDRAGTRTVKVPAPLRALLGDTARVVAARSCNWDADEELEWLVITSGPPATGGRARPQSVRLYNRRGDEWTVERTLEIRDPVFTGPLELRDVTGDGEADFVYRCFLESPGHFWVDAHILSRHPGWTPVAVPAVFQPTTATGPVR
jgi:hypothetical protein